MHIEYISKTMKKRRSVLKISQQNLADLSGVGVRTIKEIETNQGNPTITTLSKILDVLGMEFELKIKSLLD